MPSTQATPPAATATRKRVAALGTARNRDVACLISYKHNNARFAVPFFSKVSVAHMMLNLDKRSKEEGVMTGYDMEQIISEVEHSLAVEHLYMTETEKESLRRVGRKELTVDELIAQYVSGARKLAASQPSHPSHSCDHDPDDPRDPFVYPGTHLLVNEFGLKDSDGLSAVERQITGAAYAKLEQYPIDGCFDLDHLRSIHKTLFGEIYSWAGRIRSKGFISKGNSLFCAAEFIEPYSSELFGRLQGENLLAGLDRERFIERIAFYISEVKRTSPISRRQRENATHLCQPTGTTGWMELKPGIN